MTPFKHTAYRLWYCNGCDPEGAQDRADQWDPADGPEPVVFESRYEVLVPIGETFGGEHGGTLMRIPEKGDVSCPFTTCPRCGEYLPWMAEHYTLVVTSPEWDEAFASWQASRAAKAAAATTDA